MSSEPITDLLSIDQGISIPDVLTRHPEKIDVRLVGERCRYNIRVQREDLDAVRAASALDLPDKIGASSATQDRKILCLGPDEWIIVAHMSEAARLRRTCRDISQEFTLSTVDISHRNVAFSLTGSLVANLINIGCPLDLAVDRFPIGKSTRTVFENAEIMLLRESKTGFYLETWRSFAPYVCSFFEKFATATQYDTNT